MIQGQDQTKSIGLDKEALLSACRKSEASYTVEAAVSLFIFMCVLVTTMVYMRLVTIQYSVKRVMHETARQAAALGESPDFLADTVGKEGEETAWKAYLSAKCRAGLKEDKVPVTYIRDELEGLDFSDTKVDDRFINLECDFTLNVAGDFINDQFFRVHEKASARRYVGWDPSMEEDGVYVYITPNGNDYHRSRECNYLDLSIRAVSKSNLEKERNRSGAKYSCCEKCGDSGAGICYVTDYGTTFHSSLECSGLKRTLIRIKLEEAKKGYKPCPKCAGE